MSAEPQSAGGSGTDEATEGPAMGRRAFLAGSVAAATAAGGSAAASPVAAQAYDGWFDDVDNYEGTVDYRGEDEVTVAVGAGEDGLLFDPAAVLVDPGTTVVFEWTGEGGAHNVVHEPGEEDDPAFATELYSEAGATFEQTFDEEGTYRYYCEPHRGVGMKGAVAVGEVDDELIEPSDGDGGGGQPLTATDMVVAGVGAVVALALLAVVARPGSLEADRT